MDRLAAQTLTTFEVILVRNEKTLEHVNGKLQDECCRAFRFPIQWVQVHPDCIGISRARNLGANLARAQLLLFLDPDVALADDTLERMAAKINLGGCAGVFGSYDGLTPHKNFSSRYKAIFNHHFHQESQENAATFWSACGMIKREIFFKAGGFDESYKNPCIEDIDLGYRVRAIHETIRLDHALLVQHQKHWAFFGLVKSDIFDRAIPWTILLSGQSTNHFELNLSLKSRLSVCLAWLSFMSILSGWGFVCIGLLIVLNQKLLGRGFRQYGFLFGFFSLAMTFFVNFYSGLGYLVGQGIVVKDRLARVAFDRQRSVAEVSTK